MFVVKVENGFLNNVEFPKMKIVTDIKEATTFGSVYAANQFAEELKKNKYKNVYPEFVERN